MKTLWFFYVPIPQYYDFQGLTIFIFILNGILNFTFNICSLDWRTNL